MLSPEFCNATEVRKAIGQLNKSGILKEKIKAVGVKKADLVKNFLDAVDMFPEDSEEAGKIPAEVIKVYNSIVEGEDPSPEEMEKMKKAKAAKKETKPRGPSNEAKALEIYTANQAAGADAVKKAMEEYFGPYYKARGKTDADFVSKRIGIYTNIAKKAFLKDHPEEAAKEAAAKEKAAKEKAEAKKAAKEAEKTEEASAEETSVA